MHTNTHTCSYLANAALSVRFVPPPPRVPETGGSVEVCTEVVAGQLAPGRTAVLTLSTNDIGSAQGKSQLQSALSHTHTHTHTYTSLFIHLFILSLNCHFRVPGLQ